MEFRVLGPISVVRDGAEVALPGRKPRKLLARLLVDAGSVVSVDAAIEALWSDDDLPDDPPGTVQVYVSNLRRALDGGRDRDESVIRTVSPGYAIVLDEHEVDAQRLTSLVGEARRARAEGDPASAIAAARSAVDLVRGDPYADVAYEDWARTATLELAELVVAAHEELHAATLAAGHPDAAIPALEALVAAHPFRERLRALLMTALYRVGRQADALRCCADGRRVMIDELGVEPGPELRQLEDRILAQDPDLLLAPAAPTPEPRAPSRSVGLFGRERELGALDGVLDLAHERLQVALLRGESGMGKSALAQWTTARARALGFATGRGRAHDLDGAPAYWPWTEALRELDVTALGDAPSLAPLMPELAPASDATAATDRSPFLLFDAVARVLTAMSR
ncbi:MAG TPA: BTAD domain-containing putative transcriptional regulator, partial [Acidimicrobiia bacterium]|nr:BTAD domain-containing putative transcriptional regulator [Acidimicrobiia bacterium]